MAKFYVPLWVAVEASDAQDAYDGFGYNRVELFEVIDDPDPQLGDEVEFIVGRPVTEAEYEHAHNFKGIHHNA